MSEEGQAKNQASQENVVSNKDNSGEAISSTGKASEVSPKVNGSAEETLKLPAEEMVKRRSRWQSSLAALRYINSVSQDNEVKVRDSDRATSLTLLIVCVIALVSLVAPFLAPWRIGFVGASDVLVGVGLLMYVANRFGIVTTLTPRQALLTWQLMLGSSLLGIFMAINLAMVIGVVVANTHIEIPR